MFSQYVRQFFFKSFLSKIEFQLDQTLFLIGIKFVTGTEDWFNGETVNKRCRDKAGRLYEMYITVCTYDDEQAQAIGGGLATNSEVQEIIRTPLPCNPEIIKDEYADYQKVRWYREDIKGGIPDEKGDKYGEDWGHMPGSERNELVRQIVKIYNSFGRLIINISIYHN